MMSNSTSSKKLPASTQPKIQKHKVSATDRERICKFIQQFSAQTDNKRFGDYTLLYKRFLDEHPEFKGNITYGCFMHYVKFPPERNEQLKNSLILDEAFNKFMNDVSTSNNFHTYRQEYQEFIKQIAPMNLNTSLCYSNYCRKRHKYFQQLKELASTQLGKQQSDEKKAV